MGWDTSIKMNVQELGYIHRRAEFELRKLPEQRHWDGKTFSCNKHGKVWPTISKGYHHPKDRAILRPLPKLDQIVKTVLEVSPNPDEHTRFRIDLAPRIDDLYRNHYVIPRLRGDSLGKVSLAATGQLVCVFAITG